MADTISNQTSDATEKVPEKVRTERCPRKTEYNEIRKHLARDGGKARRQSVGFSRLCFSNRAAFQNH